MKNFVSARRFFVCGKKEERKAKENGNHQHNKKRLKPAIHHHPAEVEDTGHGSEEGEPIHRPPEFHVRFALSRIQVIRASDLPHHSITARDNSKLWYSTMDCLNMYNACQLQALRSAASSSTTRGTACAIRDAYTAIQDAPSFQTVQAMVKETYSIPHADKLAGLEQLLVRETLVAICPCHHALNHIRSFEAAKFRTVEEKEAVLQSLISKSSRVDVLFDYYLAQVRHH